VSCADGEAKFWLDPIVELVKSHGLSQMQIGEMRKIVEERQNELARAWISHFRS
jgi:predicted XRE-type DNA-binding protein